MAKSFLKSITIWVNLIIGAPVIFQEFTGIQIIPMILQHIDVPQLEILIGMLATFNVISRFVAKEEIYLKPS